MKHQDIVELIRPAISEDLQVWADLGAGAGNFSFALDEILGFDGTIFAVDRRLDIFRERVKSGFVRSKIHFLESDISEAISLLPTLDGILMANTLHYIKDQVGFLKKVLPLIADHGVFVLVEYDREDANQWIPYPVSYVSWQRVALKAGLSLPEEIGRLPSIYEKREIYASVVTKASG